MAFKKRNSPTRSVETLFRVGDLHLVEKREVSMRRYGRAEKCARETRARPGEMIEEVAFILSPAAYRGQPDNSVWVAGRGGGTLEGRI